MNASAILTGLDLLIQLLDRTSAAAAIVKKAHAEGRQPSSDELATLRGELDGHLATLDAAIAQAKAEGR